MEPLKHECGVATIRLLKPLEYYQQKYGTWMYALNKLYLMMEKQHNRGGRVLVWLVSNWAVSLVMSICSVSVQRARMP